MSLIEEIRTALAGLPSLPRYELFCHPSVYYALQRIGDIQPMFNPHPLDAIYGASVIVAPDLGPGIWELYGNNKLVGYGRFRERA